MLILSQFAGAAEAMKEALIVNPYDIEQVAYAMQMALHMPLNERRERHQALLATIQREDVHAWSRAFLARLARTKEAFADTLPLDTASTASKARQPGKRQKAHSAE